MGQTGIYRGKKGGLYLRQEGITGWQCQWGYWGAGFHKNIQI